MEKILKADEIWFSNPLFMNDIEEVRFGFFHAMRTIRESGAIKEALGTSSRHDIFLSSLDHQVGYYDNEHLLDTYIFCLSEHSPEDRDGLLSMWRGYGGNGKGAALVLDTSKLTYTDPSPLVLAPVQYGSTEERQQWCVKTASIIASVLARNHFPDDKLHMAAAVVIERIKLFSLFTKHHGFKEEKEWRVAYMSDRDHDRRLQSSLNYLNGPRGIEPKLRYKVAPSVGVLNGNASLDHLLIAILLGPSTTSPLAMRSAARMLDLIGKSSLKDRLFASSIPFRGL